MATRPVGEKRGPKIGDAASLWNFTPSPGWSKEEAHVLKLCLMKFGVGKWVQILETGLLPGKLIQQLNGQTQRLLGQQSLAAFTGIQIDIDRVRADNEANSNAQRKGGLIINTGPNLNREMKDKLQEEARATYGLTPEQIVEAEEQLEELAATMKSTGSGVDEATEAKVAIERKKEIALSGDITKLTKEEKVALLRELHSMLGSLQETLVQHQAAPEGTITQPTREHGTEGTHHPFSSDQENQTANAVPQVHPKQDRKHGIEKTGGKKQTKERRSAGKRRSVAVDEDDDDEMREATMANGVAVAADVATLVAMGFGERQAKDALEEAGGSVEGAAEWLTQSLCN